MSIRVVQLGSPRDPGEGLRIGTVRRPPRGVPKARLGEWYDVWLPQLAPSAELVKSARAASSEREWQQFVRKYRAEMAQPDNARLIALLAALSRTTDFSLGCYCEDERRCHRSLLRELLAGAGAAFRSAAAKPPLWKAAASLPHSEAEETLRRWTGLADDIERALRELPADARGRNDGMTPRETAHHIAEANLVAANQILVALGVDDYELDWSWLWPDRAWMNRLGYGELDAVPAIAMLRAMTGYVAQLVARDPKLFARHVRLRDSKDDEPYAITIEGILEREIDHAREHLDELR